MATQKAAAAAPTATSQGLTATAHVGDRAVLLAFDIAPEKKKDLAGFAVRVTTANGSSYWMKNRLTFDQPITKTKGLNDAKTPGAKYADSVDAPYQMFHWVDFPPGGAGKYTYEVTARYFTPGTKKVVLKDGPKVSLEVEIEEQQIRNLSVGMTRGYVSSQAFIDKFAEFDKNGSAILWPKPQTIDFDTAPYEKVYAYLGAHGRKLVFDFLDELQAKTADLDMFAYDFNEPDVVRAVEALHAKGAKVRLYLDDSTSHAPANKPESQIAKKFESLGIEVERGHFKRFAHDKVLIMKSGGKAVKVLTGSANFSLRGLYVQANSVLLFEDPTIAGWYEQAFEQAWSDAKGFAKSSIAAKWFDESLDDSRIRISFAPHQKPWPLDDAARAVKAAATSVFFATMETAGAGALFDSLKTVGSRSAILSLGTIEKSGQVTTFKGGKGNSQVVSFDYLKKHAPGPFKAEVDAGQGQHIHHKFVVCDFNGSNPVVFCGSSNLAAGGEISNGDNLLAIYDREIATAYAVEAIRLFDHYRFRSKQSKSTSAKPLGLAKDDKWTDAFFDPKDIKYRERAAMVQTRGSHPQVLPAAGPQIPIAAKGKKAAAKPRASRAPAQPRR